MAPAKDAAKAPRAKSPAIARAKAWIGAAVTDLEFRLRTAKPFTHGEGRGRVFYPGCSLPAADPELVMRAFAWLRARDPGVTLWSDCCGMPLEKFSTEASAEAGRERTRRELRDRGTTEIITACGNCTLQFESLKVPGLKLTSLYGLLAEEDWGPRAPSAPTLVHHPCSARIDKAQQEHFQRFADKLHLTVVDAGSSKHPLACCLVKTPQAMAKRAAIADQQVVTYCAHCTMEFGKDVPTRHVLQEAFGEPGAQWAPKGKVARFRSYQRLAALASASGPATAGAGGGRGWASVALGLAVIAALVAGVAFRAPLAARALELVAWARDAGLFGALVYGLVYVVATVLALPGSLLTLGAGFAWGPLVGVAIVSPVSTLAATAAFVLGRTLFRARVERTLGHSPRLAAIDRAVADHGLAIVLLLRLSPILPFNALNYALALTRVRTRDYVLGSLVGMLPGAALYVYLGSLVTSASELLAGRRPSSPLGAALSVVGLVATIAAVVVTTRLARARLDRALAEAAP
jgi:uncharacterized membrane protein YdjX (TVP38/TMEM64 family)